MMPRSLYLLFAMLMLSIGVGSAQMMENILYQSPSVPKSVVEQSDRVDYILRNYWGNFNFRNIELIENRRYTEGAYREFVRLTEQLSDEKFVVANGELFVRADVNASMINHFAELADRIYFVGDSVNIDAERYSMMLHKLVASRNLSASNRKKYSARIESLKPVVVEPEPVIAPDIEYTRRDLTESNLYSIRANYVLLMIDSDTTIDNQIKGDSLLLDFHDVVPLSISSEGDLESWLMQPKAEWCGYDHSGSVGESRLYSEQSRIMLLDKRKRILLDQSTIERIIAHLKSLGEPPAAIEEVSEVEPHL